MGLSGRSPIPRIKYLLKVHSKALSSSTTTTATPTPTPTSPIESLPPHVISEIGRHCHLLRDVLNFSLSCRRFRTTLAPILYSTVELKTNKQVKTTLASLAKLPDLSRHIQTLVIRPNCAEWTASNDLLDESAVADWIMHIASDLEALESFTWDGLEMPVDMLWLVLRTSCPNLKCLYTSIGEDAVKGSSHLFDFSGLTRLGVTVKCHSFEWIQNGRPPIEKLPRRFWEMLIERCPLLEELKIGGPGPSPRMFDVRHVLAGRWPLLRQLTLGDMALHPASGAREQKDDWAFMQFFAAHPGLQSVALEHSVGSDAFPPSFYLPPTALPAVESFNGPVKFVRTLPHKRLLKHLTLTCLHHSVSTFPPTYATLHELSSLVSLNIWIDLSFGGGRGVPAIHDDGHIFRSLLASCPGLMHLEVMCFTRPAFHVKEFSHALRLSPQLTSFVLTKLHKSGDEDPLRSAVRIVQDNPNLKRFTLRYALDSWFSQSGGRLKQLGSYEVVADEQGKPTSLLVYEMGTKSFGGEYSRTYVHTLPAMNSPVKKTHGRRQSWSSGSSHPPVSINSRSSASASSGSSSEKSHRSTLSQGSRRSVFSHTSTLFSHASGSGSGSRSGSGSHTSSFGSTKG
ncbi:hypothetical protein BDQ12DRAFT_694285 [Crucibulum laeve]|uniref:F-box domain-containing protein n=1 Tax=Crucibulum laeve TaxID=68775 RepID=A0A5C3LF60_9AGAR|nr:hypothetical protein BDQ12DRAFT_694285 [Crucibulum laeve]